VPHSRVLQHTAVRHPAPLFNAGPLVHCAATLHVTLLTARVELHSCSVTSVPGVLLNSTYAGGQHRLAGRPTLITSLLEHSTVTLCSYGAAPITACYLFCMLVSLTSASSAAVLAASPQVGNIRLAGRPTSDFSLLIAQ
jgi:hypothetical protein